MSAKIGSFQVDSLLGEGAFGYTFRGSHGVLGTKMPVCIKERKVLVNRDEDAHSRKMFREEALLLSKVRHFGLPVLLDYFEGPDTMVLSFIEGETLEDDVKKSGPVTDEHLCWILDRILSPLDYLHGRWQMVHCDLKPANVLIDIPNHECTVVDLGLATMDPNDKTRAKGGTPGYMPPEFELGYPPLPSSDLYSVGKIAIYLTTGNEDMVYRGECPADMCPALRELIGKMILREPKNRLQSAGNARDLLAWLRKKEWGRSSTLKVIERRTK